MTKRATWQGIILAKSDNGVVVEGNYYFPPEDVNDEYFVESPKHTICPWKGKAHYYHLETDETREEDIAWYYPEAKEEAKKIEGYVAFDSKVTIK